MFFFLVCANIWRAQYRCWSIDISYERFSLAITLRAMQFNKNLFIAGLMHWRDVECERHNAMLTETNRILIIRETTKTIKHDGLWLRVITFGVWETKRGDFNYASMRVREGAETWKWELWSFAVILSRRNFYCRFVTANWNKLRWYSSWKGFNKSTFCYVEIIAKFLFLSCGFIGDKNCTMLNVNCDVLLSLRIKTVHKVIKTTSQHLTQVPAIARFAVALS